MRVRTASGSWPPWPSSRSWPGRCSASRSSGGRSTRGRPRSPGRSPDRVCAGSPRGSSSSARSSGWRSPARRSPPRRSPARRTSGSTRRRRRSSTTASGVRSSCCAAWPRSRSRSSPAPPWAACFRRWSRPASPASCSTRSLRRPSGWVYRARSRSCGGPTAGPWNPSSSATSMPRDRSCPGRRPPRERQCPRKTRTSSPGSPPRAPRRSRQGRSASGSSPGEKPPGSAP